MLNLHWGLSIPSLIVFGQLLEPMKKDYFQSSIIAIYSKKSQIFQGKLCQMFFLLYTLIKLVILHNELGSIWITFWPNENELFLKFLIRETQKVPYEMRMRWYFLTQWTTFWPNENELFLKFLICETQKFPYEMRVKYLLFLLGRL